MPSLRISEVFASLQGEGVSTGVPATFLRLGDCNLRCGYCDTPYSWDWRRYDRKAELTEQDVLVTAARIREFAPRRLVITGGEPLLQQPSLEALVSTLGDFTLEVETNGTLLPSEMLSARIDQWNVSPKLETSGMPLTQRHKIEALDAFRRTGRAWLKFVVSDARDVDEVQDLVKCSSWPRDKVILMPEARTAQQLLDRSPQVAQAALENGFSFSTRLHVMLWGDTRGR